MLATFSPLAVCFRFGVCSGLRSIQKCLVGILKSCCFGCVAGSRFFVSSLEKKTISIFNCNPSSFFSILLSTCVWMSSIINYVTVECDFQNRFMPLSIKILTLVDFRAIKMHFAEFLFRFDWFRVTCHLTN